MRKSINEIESRITIENPRGGKLLPYIAFFLCLLATVYSWHASSR